MLVYPIAKINIGLYITEKRQDGYHNIESLFYPIPLHDNLEISELKYSNAPYALQVAGNKISGTSEDNLVVKAYKLLQEEFKFSPLDINLFKRIPMGAGLGGGSSDAAYMVKAINEYFDLGLSYEEMEKRVVKIGADCPFFIRAKASLATGIGDILTPFDFSLQGYHLLLIKSQETISTKAAYQGVCPHRPMISLKKALNSPIEEWKKRIKNDFEQSVFSIYPNIGAIKSTLYDMGAVYASMSGSGSAVYGIFRNKPLEADEIFKDCYVYQTLLLN